MYIFANWQLCSVKWLGIPPAELKYDACNHKDLLKFIVYVHTHHPSEMQNLKLFLALCFVWYQIQDTLASKYKKPV